MHVRYKLRKPNSLVNPKGPSFSSARIISSDIDETNISFKAPKHRPRHTNHEQQLPKSSYSMDDIVFRSNYDKDINVSDNWKEFDLFYNAWAFYGPWFTGTLAELKMSFRLVKLNKNNEFSLFHPRAFEKVVGDYLTNSFSKYTSESHNGKQHYIAPVNWEPLLNLPVIAAKLEVVSDPTVIWRTTKHFVFYPISNNVMACIQFTPSRILNASQEQLDKRVSRTTMYELMNNIINSLQLTLSPEAEAQQKKALEGLENTSLIKDYPPIKWGSKSSNSEQAIEEQ